MPSRDRVRLALLAGGGALGAVLVAGLLLIELLVDAPFRNTATRLVAAAVLTVVALRVRTLVRLGLAGQPRSSFDAGEPVSGPGADRPRFQQFHDEIRFSATSQRYFEHVLWPRLVTLVEARTGEPAHWLPKLPGRSFGRGPSLDALGRLIASIEARR